MPDETPILGLPFPLPEDPLVDYPALGQELAEKIEAGGLARLWDSRDAGVVFPTYYVTTSPLPQTFKHLAVVWAARSDRAAEVDWLNLRLNDLSAAAYYDQTILGNPDVDGAGTVTASNRWYQSATRLGIIAALNATSGGVGSGVIFLPAYTDPNVVKVAIALSGVLTGASNVNTYAGLHMGAYGAALAEESPAPFGLESLTFLSEDGAQLVDPTRLTVYGLG
jgi:hypothetical protein